MSTDFLRDKVAIVTGASSGIGWETALALAKEGACVALAARRAEALHKLAEQIKKQGRKTLILQTDVTQREQVEAIITPFVIPAEEPPPET